MGGMSGIGPAPGTSACLGWRRHARMSVVFARLDIDRDGVGRTLFQTGHVVGLVEKRDADLAGERTFVHLEDHVLTLPFAACRRSFCHGHYFVNCSFEFHGDAVNGLIILFSAKVTKNRKNPCTRRQNSRANFSGGELRGAAIFCILRRRTGKTAQACDRRILWMPKSGIPHVPIGCSVGCALQIRQKRPAFLQIFDFQWTQRGMIPRPSDYESAALTD